MSWAHPEVFWLLLALPVLFVCFLHHERRSERLLGELVAPRLRPSLAGTVSRGGRRLRMVLVLAGLGAVLVALAQPRAGFREQERKGTGRDIIIALDVSRSMLADDLSPSRLARAKLSIEDLIRNLRGDRVGLVGFAGTAFLQAPLTADYAEVLATLREMEPKVLPVGGTNLAEAIRAAMEAFGKGESDHRALVIFTDGEELEADGLEAAREAAKAAKIYTVGCGTTGGTIITVPNAQGRTDYVKGPDGQIVKSRLDEKRLREIAEAAGGFYIHLQNGPPEMQRLMQDGLERLTLKENMEVQTQRQPIERYQWPLAAGLVLLLASMLPGERRRPAARARVAGATGVGLLVLLWAGPANAKNAGLEAYERQDYEKARQEFQEQVERRPDFAPLQFNLGAAAYKAGELDRALGAFSKAVTTKDPELREKSEYNLGNTLFQRGAAQKRDEAKLQDWKNSQQHYEEALKIQPKNENAKFNRDLVAQLIAKLEEKKQQEEEKKKEEEEKSGEEKKGEEKEGEKKEGEQKQAQKGEKKEGQRGEEKEGEGVKEDPNGDKKMAKKEDGEEKKGGDGKLPEDALKEDEKGEKAFQKKGEIADADPQQAAQMREEARQEAQRIEEEARAAAEGKMTEAQAKALLDSVRSEDQRVRLWNPKGQARPKANLRDW